MHWTNRDNPRDPQLKGHSSRVHMHVSGCADVMCHAALPSFPSTMCWAGQWHALQAFLRHVLHSGYEEVFRWGVQARQLYSASSLQHSSIARRLQWIKRVL